MMENHVYNIKVTSCAGIVIMENVVQEGIVIDRSVNVVVASNELDCVGVPTTVYGESRAAIVVAGSSFVVVQLNTLSPWKSAFYQVVASGINCKNSSFTWMSFNEITCFDVGIDLINSPNATIASNFVGYSMNAGIRVIMDGLNDTFVNVTSNTLRYNRAGSFGGTSVDLSWLESNECVECWTADDMFAIFVVIATCVVAAFLIACAWVVKQGWRDAPVTSQGKPAVIAKDDLARPLLQAPATTAPARTSNVRPRVPRGKMTNRSIAMIVAGICLVIFMLVPFIPHGDPVPRSMVDTPRVRPGADDRRGGLHASPAHLADLHTGAVRRDLLDPGWHQAPG